MHHKLPDQKQVRRISGDRAQDERLELNLYIVGEDGDEQSRQEEQQA